MKDIMFDDLIGMTAIEQEKAVAFFDALVSSKEKEIAFCQNAIDTKVTRVEEVKVDFEAMKDDLADPFL